MRILHVGQASVSSNNGVHRSIHTLAGLASASGHEGLAVRFSRSVSTPERAVREGVEQYTLPVMGPRGSAGAFLQVLTPAGKKALNQILEDVDVLHLHSVFQIDHSFVARRRVPYIVTPHGGYHPRVLARTNASRKRLWSAVFDKRILNRAEFVHVLTANEAEHVAAVQPGARTRVLPIPLGDLTIGSARSREGGPVVFMGRLDIDHKGLDLLLEAWSCTLGDWQSRKELIIAGPGDDQNTRQLGELIFRLGLHDSVRLVGPVSGHAKQELLANASWFVHTSRREGLPLAMVEAAACGAPLLGTFETNLSDQIEAHGAGLSSGQGVEQIAAMFSRAASLSSEEYLRHSQGAIDLAGGFRTEVLWPRFEGLYEEASRDGRHA